MGARRQDGLADSYVGRNVTLTLTWIGPVDSCCIYARRQFKYSEEGERQLLEAVARSLVNTVTEDKKESERESLCVCVCVCVRARARVCVCNSEV
jgi:hypothetical protein